MLRRCSIRSFEKRLFRIGADEARRADWIAEKINELGGSLARELTIQSTEKNSWHYWLDDLEEERRCSADLKQRC